MTNKPKLMTKKGFRKLKVEFDELSLKERPKVVAQVSEAAAMGDRSENAEYIYGKKRLREIDKRLFYLSALLKNPKIIGKSELKTDVVGFGAKVSVINEEGQKKTWTIVGEGEADLKEQSISIDSLVAQALLGKKVGDIVEVELAKGNVELELIKIEPGDIE